MQIDNLGYVYKCDWCGVIKNHAVTVNHNARVCECAMCTEEILNFDIKFEVWSAFFRNSFGTLRGLRLPKDFPQDTCLECTRKLTPWVEKFADIYLLNTYVNKLKGQINDKISKNRSVTNNRAVENNACQCGQGGNARTVGH
jgi:hypothetical protein